MDKDIFTVEAILRGQKEIDRMLKELEELPKKLIWLFNDSKYNNKTLIPFAPKGRLENYCVYQSPVENTEKLEWYLVIDDIGTPRGVLLYIDGKRIFKHHHGFDKPKIDKIQFVHSKLQFLVDGFISQFPFMAEELAPFALASKNKQH